MRPNLPSSPSQCVSVPAACWVRCERPECGVSYWPCGFSSLLYLLVWALAKGEKVPEEVAGSRDLWIGPHHWWRNSSSCFFLQDSGTDWLQADILSSENLVDEKDTYYRDQLWWCLFTSYHWYIWKMGGRPYPLDLVMLLFTFCMDIPELCKLHFFLNIQHGQHEFFLIIGVRTCALLVVGWNLNYEHVVSTDGKQLQWTLCKTEFNHQAEISEERDGCVLCDLGKFYLWFIVH